VGGSCQGRTGSIRSEASARHDGGVGIERACRAKSAGTAGSSYCRAWAEQCRGSRGLIRIPKDRRGASDEGLSQAWHPLTHSTCSHPAGQRHPRLKPSRSIEPALPNVILVPRQSQNSGDLPVASDSEMCAQFIPDQRQGDAASRLPPSTKPGRWLTSPLIAHQHAIHLLRRQLEKAPIGRL
jgi:hypothetical protein